MNIAELAIRKGTVTWTLSLAVLILGWLAYQGLPRLEDPELTIREARVITPYPGASAAQVEQDVSGKIEEAAGQLSQLRRVESRSERGLSVVSVVVRDSYGRQELRQIWDELRRRVGDLQARLPPGAGPSLVRDDLDDLYGIYYALVGKGFTQRELLRVAEQIRHELSTVDGVKKTILFGERREAIYVEVSKARTKALGVGIDEVFEALRNKNLPADAGRLRVGPEHVPIHPGGLYQSEQDLGDLMIAGDNDRLVRLADLAEIRRDYEDPPRSLLRVDGDPAIGIAAAMISGGDPIALGEAVGRRLAQLESRIPLGMELKVIALESKSIAHTIDGLITSLALAFAFIIVALMLFMGLRGGLIVGFVSLLTLAGTLLAMDSLQIGLDRISLGSLVIALGLVVDNAILILDGIKLHMERGKTAMQASRDLVFENAIPLLGATAVAVLAFAAIGGIGNQVGEYARALHLVVPIALALSWVTAVTVVPLLAERFLTPAAPGGETRDPYDGRFFRLYAKVLSSAIRQRRAVLAATTLLLALSLYGLGFVKKAFFPPAATPVLQVEVHFREGTHIRETERGMDEIQAYLRSREGVTQVATAIGDGHPRHIPTENPGLRPGSNYGLSLVFVDEYRRIDEIRSRIQADLEERIPDAVINVKKRSLASEAAGGGVQLRINGPDAAELRRLADRAKAIIASDPDAKAIRDEWGAKVKVAHPVLAADRSRRLRIDRSQISSATRTAYSGTLTGFYREGGKLIPIVARAPLEERSAVEDMADIPVASPLRGDKVSMLQLVERLDTLTEDARRSRRDGLPVLMVHADADQGPISELYGRIRPRVERALSTDAETASGQDPGRDFKTDFDALFFLRDDPTPVRGKPGYFLSWGGEAERAAETRAELASSIPLYAGLAVLVTVVLFNALRQPLIVLLTAPLSMIGVTAGLLSSGQPFGVMSLLGVVGLFGLIMRNAVVAVDRIDREMRTEKTPLSAILDGGVAALRPVALASGTTVLAMLPLLQHDFFVSMAVTMISGLAVATLLSLVLVPVLYATLFCDRVSDRGSVLAL